MPQPNDLSRSLVALDHNSTIIAVVELSQSSWLVGGGLPGIERQPRKKLEPSPERLLALLHRWRDEAIKAGRDGFWLARWLAARGVEAHVIHPSSVAVSREHRRAKTDRLDTELLKRGFLGWLPGERGHCSMARVPTTAEEDAKHAMILLDDATPKPDGIFGKDRGAGDGGSNRTSGDVTVVGHLRV